VEDLLQRRLGAGQLVREADQRLAGAPHVIGGFHAGRVKAARGLAQHVADHGGDETADQFVDFAGRV
jgi:hypothetical protein